MGKGCGKRAYGHLEMIIAFVLFVGFVSFLIIFIKPTNNSNISDSIAVALRDSFLNSAKTNYTRFFVSIKTSDPGAACFSINLDERAFIYPSVAGFVEKASTKQIVSSKINSGYEIIALGGGDSYYVSISPDFNSSPSSGISCSSDSTYNLGSIDERTIVSKKGLDEIKTRYDSNYNSLRSDLGVPPTFDFAIVSEDLPEIDMEKTAPDNSDVVAIESSENVLFSNGEIKPVKFIFKVW